VLHARADVILTTDIPSAPVVQPVPTLGPYARSLDEVYDRLLFHGPLLHAIEQVEGCGAAGVTARLRAAPSPSSWLTRPLRQRWLADPLVLDGGFQLLVLWSMEQRGTPCLPCHAARYRQFLRSFPPGGTRAVVRVLRAAEHNVLADLDYLDANGRLIARMEGCECVLDAGLARAFARRHAAPALA
jgi:hypothetical protein